MSLNKALIDSRNTVFEGTINDFVFCGSEEEVYYYYIVSKKPLKVLQCLYNSRDKRWFANCVGTFNAVFETDQSGRNCHFPGILYTHIEL